MRNTKKLEYGFSNEEFEIRLQRAQELLYENKLDALLITIPSNLRYFTGIDTNFNGQLVRNDKVVIRGQTYKVVKINSRTEMYVQPQYRGLSSDGIILTKTIDVRVAQDNWNLD